MKENNLSKLLDVLIYILVVLIFITLYYKNTNEQNIPHNTEPIHLKGDAYYGKGSELFKTKVLSNGKVGTKVMNNTYITPEGDLHYGF